jgi:hypothetical protein
VTCSRYKGGNKNNILKSPLNLKKFLRSEVPRNISVLLDTLKSDEMGNTKRELELIYYNLWVIRFMRFI